MFSAESIGQLITQTQSKKKVNVAVIRARVRQDRRDQRRWKEAAIRSWWDFRRDWPSMKVGNRIGKWHPSLNRIEFPDGTTTPAPKQ